MSTKKLFKNKNKTKNLKNKKRNEMQILTKNNEMPPHTCKNSSSVF